MKQDARTRPIPASWHPQWQASLRMVAGRVVQFGDVERTRIKTPDERLPTQTSNWPGPGLTSSIIGLSPPKSSLQSQLPAGVLMIMTGSWPPLATYFLHSSWGIVSAVGDWAPASEPCHKTPGEGVLPWPTRVFTVRRLLGLPYDGCRAKSIDTPLLVWEQAALGGRSSDWAIIRPSARQDFMRAMTVGDDT